MLNWIEENNKSEIFKLFIENFLNIDLDEFEFDENSELIIAEYMIEKMIKTISSANSTFT